ncbi:MAG: hypothetical protein JXR97_09675, partial [Planctomycetes bacterium]|nr:hypothetical protein [Planctomycetota bacterium]
NTGEIKNELIIWNGKYGSGSAAATALICLCIYRINGDKRLLDWAVNAAKLYHKTEFPAGVQVPVYVPGALMLLLTDLYSITGDEGWLQEAEEQLGKLMPIYMGESLPLGANGYGYYESQHLPGYLLRGATRLALFRKGKEIAPDYTMR